MVIGIRVWALRFKFSGLNLVGFWDIYIYIYIYVRGIDVGFPSIMQGFSVFRVEVMRLGGFKGYCFWVCFFFWGGYRD